MKALALTESFDHTYLKSEAMSPIEGPKNSL